MNLGSKVIHKRLRDSFTNVSHILCARRRGYSRAVAILLLVAVSVIGFGVGSVAAQSAPDCSNIGYDGAGTTTSPYEVTNVSQLQCIEDQGLDANYVQVSDIDASGTASWNGGSGFDPIGDINDMFGGTFDGADRTISGLTIDRGSADDVGLFEALSPRGRIEDVGAENVNITGDDDVGGLVGVNRGTVRESYATGTVSGNSGVGGLIGVNGNDNSPVSDGVVAESYAIGNVFGNADVGGLVGFNELGNVTESYATVKVDGSFAVGGLVGGNSGDGNVTESYATGNVSGDTFVGGLVGDKTLGNVTESYWDTQTTGQPTSDGGTGLTTSEMTGSSATSNMLGFDFTSTWEAVTNPDDYPILRWQTQTGSSPANFEVSVSTNSPVTEGDTLTVTATVTNTGGQRGTQDITASASGLGSVTRTVMLDSGESRTETVSVPTSTGDAGNPTVTVQTQNDTATTTVTIQQAGGGSVVDNYRNSNGNVDTGGLQQAINDFIQQKISTGNLQAVIQVFIQSQAP